MISTTIAYTVSHFQDSKDRGMPLKEKMLRTYVRNLIIEYATKKNGEFSLYADSLPLFEQAIYLSYLVDAQDYEFMTANQTRTIAAVADYLPEMQHFIDELIDDVCNDYKVEGGFSD